MPVEIKELVVRVSVNAPTQGPSPRDLKSVSSGPANSDETRNAIVAECVEQVMKILQSKSER